MATTALSHVPEVEFQTRVRDESIDGENPYRWETTHTRDYFANKRVVLFSLPGAFTPVCSTKQLPGFEENYEKIQDLGIDEIYVISVNDAFVMNAWLKHHGLTKVKAIPDGNGVFTRKMGYLVPKNNLGFGERSWRYAMVVNNRMIEQVFEEKGICADSGPDPYEESTPEKVIAWLQDNPRTEVESQLDEE